MNISTDEIKNFYDDAIYRKLHGFIYKNNRVEYAWATLLNILKDVEPKHILEIGCGMGEISYRLAEKLPETKVTGFDISEASIFLAGKLFIKQNLNYLRADNIVSAQIAEDTKFDIVFLMDVYEHIPLNSRNELHSFIKEHIAQNGVLFLSCPTPQHLDYLRKNIPSEIQPVDENISLTELMELSRDSELRLINYKEVSVWSAADYFHVIFSNRLKMQPFSDYVIYDKKEFVGIGLKKEIRKKITKAFKRINKVEAPENDLAQKKELIKKMLGKEVLDKIEAYGK